MFKHLQSQLTFTEEPPHRASAPTGLVSFKKNFNHIGLFVIRSRCNVRALRSFRHGQEVRHRRDVLDSTEVPAEHIDPAAIDLTPLVNTLINSSQSGSRQLFSLLSVTSYSSLALHKLTLLVYNISSIRSLQSDVFRRRFCYCVTNDTNDLTDFTAVLLDVIGNSTSYLHELFKSASILSVSHRNESGCIYICVMAGKTGPEAPELWDVGSISPLFNQTIVEGRLGVGNVSSFRFPVDWNQLPTNRSHMSPSGGSSVLTSRVHATDHGGVQVRASDNCSTTNNKVNNDNCCKYNTTHHSVVRTRYILPGCESDPINLISTPGNHNPALEPPRSSAQTHTSQSSELERDHTHQATRETRGCPWRRPEQGGGATSSSTTTVGAHKLQPCVLELCKFFSQCLCRPVSQWTRTTRFCDDSHVWYETHTSEVCRRVRRISFSRNLKQRCLTKMCSKL
ncbi:HERV-H LTR-associating protein 1 [Pleuronectes platessa]|uniref:HERV-H LTR-associating protein 1 n=1 Tax=Pleuronectes platessa TaxID=8262 RepID=UPI00232A40FA|nr:HERV-H LTR-associating protein 1 [Pleuronectes platessa]